MVEKGYSHPKLDQIYLQKFLESFTNQILKKTVSLERIMNSVYIEPITTKGKYFKTHRADDLEHLPPFFDNWRDQ
jgi:hypothetical protein